MKKGIASFFVFLYWCNSYAQTIQQYPDSMRIIAPAYTISINKKNGNISYYFKSGTYVRNAVSCFTDKSGIVTRSTDFDLHKITTVELSDKTGTGYSITLTHQDARHHVSLIQYLSLYTGKPFFLLSGAARSENGAILESNMISPLAVVPEAGGKVFVAGTSPRILDVPFDNDSWVKILTAAWDVHAAPSGTSYEYTRFYNKDEDAGIVIGAVNHDFWKTGIRYGGGAVPGMLDTLIIYGGAATPDNAKLPAEYGGRDGTHDVVAHGYMQGTIIYAPLLFIGSGGSDSAFRDYGAMNVLLNGRLKWEQILPFYWNSFGVEGVLGYEKVMMPPAVTKISDYLASLKKFSGKKNVVLSIDSYDQGIYTTDVLQSISDYAKKKNQQMGFYFIPFAVWTWKNAIDKDKLQHTDSYTRDVTLKDSLGKTIVYKDGEFGAFPLDPTHPATRQRIIAELEKAKAINAKFLKIDFLSAGALESTTRYNPAVRSGMQAYNYGMRMLKSLIDSILGPDIFITQAISPMFPYQYAHTRFLSTDIYSHLRDDLPGFPNYGSTASSMITASHSGWTQGTLWPCTNMDVVVMKNFQKNPDIPEADVRTRLISMITMGSILGDGSDFRNDIAATRGKYWLDNQALTEFFVHPKAFIPLRLPDGLTQDQQISFYLRGDTVMLATLNFDLKKELDEIFSRKKLRLLDKDYNVVDVFTNQPVGKWSRGDAIFNLNTPARSAQLLKLIPVR